MQITIVTSQDKTALYEDLAAYVGSGQPESRLILVPTRAVATDLQRQLQKKLTFFAPDVRPLEQWLDEISSLNMKPETAPHRILGPTERTLVLKWLAEQDHQFASLRGKQVIGAVSSLIGDLHRADIDPEPLTRELRNRSTEGLATLLDRYRQHLAQKQWADRESIASNLTQIRPETVPQESILFYEMGHLYPSQSQTLRTLLDFLKEEERHLLAYNYVAPSHPEDSPGKLFAEQLPELLTLWQSDIKPRFRHPGTEIRHAELVEAMARYQRVSDEQQAACKTSGRLTLSRYHTLRDSVEAAFRQILSEVANGKSSFRDFAVITGDLAAIQPTVDSLANRYDLPIDCTLKPGLLGNPVMQRFLSLFSLDANEFGIDAIFEVFADNLFRIPQLEEHDEHEPPNIRSFTQFCRRYNLRTLSKVDDRLEVIQEQAIRQERNSDFYHDDPTQAERRITQLRHEFTYYREVIEKLKVFRTQYSSKKQSLKEWRAWTELRMDEQMALGSEEANRSRENLRSEIAQMSDTYRQLELDEPIDLATFVRMLELHLSQQRERSDQRPDAVLITQATYFSELQEREVFLVGMHEGGYPAADTGDFLRFRHEALIRNQLEPALPDRFAEAQHALFALLQNSRKLHCSCPHLMDQKPVIGSSLWQDLCFALQCDDDDLSEWELPEPPTNRAYSGWEERMSQAHSHGSVDELYQKESEPNHPSLIRTISAEREDIERMGIYDGVLSVDFSEQLWHSIAAVNRDLWWKRSLRNNTFETSISQLDEYAKSPLDFFFNRVLKLKPPAEFLEEAESNIKGILVHKIMEEFYTADSQYARKHPDLIWPGDNQQQSKDRIFEITEAVLNEHREELGNPDSPFPDALSHHIRSLVDAFIRYETEWGQSKLATRSASVRPADFHPDMDLKMEYRWRLRHQSEAAEVQLQGFIDRIDTDFEGNTVIILDYKTGTYSIKSFDDILSGMSFQLPIYALAMLELGAEEFLGGYYFLPVERSKSDIDITGLFGSERCIPEEVLGNKRKWKANRAFMPMEQLRQFLNQMVERRVEWIIAAIREGRFNQPLTKANPYSDFKYIHRYRSKVQSQRRTREQELRNAENDEGYRLLRYYDELPFTEV